ncbi:hypothetical protein N9E20_02910 [Crocinitomicaceae bacterium]|nr:hypothetical protein [Crocinitomicaceae bacterium]
MKKTISFLLLLLTSYTVFAQTEAWDMAPKELVELQNSAYSKCRKGDTLGAISDLTEAINRDSTYRSAYAFRGDLYRYLKEYSNALLDYEKALEISDYNSFMTQEGIGRLKFETKEYASAYNIYTDLVERDPIDIGVKYFKALSAYYLQDYFVAIEELNNAILFDNGEGNSLGFEGDTKACYYRANSKLKLKQYAEAIKDYDLVILRSSPSHTASTYYQRGLAKKSLNLSYLGDFYKACELGLEKACYLDTDKQVKTQLPHVEKSLKIDFDQVLKKATLNSKDNSYEFKNLKVKLDDSDGPEWTSFIEIKASSLSSEHAVAKFSLETYCYCVAPFFSIKYMNGKFIEQVLSTEEGNPKRKSCTRVSTITLLNFDEIESIKIYEDECGLKSVNLLLELYTL